MQTVAHYFLMCFTAGAVPSLQPAPRFWGNLSPKIVEHFPVAHAALLKKAHRPEGRQAGGIGMLGGQCRFQGACSGRAAFVGCGTENIGPQLVAGDLAGHGGFYCAAMFGLPRAHTMQHLPGIRRCHAEKVRHFLDTPKVFEDFLFQAAHFLHASDNSNAASM